MNCDYCGFYNEHPTDHCERCGAEMPEPECAHCGVEVEWGVVKCEQCERLEDSADKTPCPSCGALNTVSAEYCTSCGTPMAVITRVMKLSRARDREPLETWRVFGIETQMVGRDDEIGQLHEHLDEVIEETRARVVTVSSKTGLGKSRLLAEFQRALDEALSEAVYMEAASRDESGGPYSMFARLLKNRFYIGEGDHPDSARRKLEEAVVSIVPDEVESERITHLVGHLMGMEFDGSPYVPDIRDSEGAYRLDERSFDAVAELIGADAAKNPLVISLEDLQYATTQSAALIEHLAERLSDRPILFVLTWNPDEIFLSDVLEDFTVDDHIELKPLSDAEVRAFVRSTLHKAPDVPETLVENIVDAAHGNPLSVEEILRILITQGVIDTREAEWEIDEERLEDVELPTTVEATVRARLAALTEDERDVLGMAACAGDSFWPELITSLYRAQQDHRDAVKDYWQDASVDVRIDDVLESLERKDMIRRRDSDSQVPPYDEYYFKHRIERVTVYEDLEAQTKQRHHRLIAQWLEREIDETNRRTAELVARHFDRARSLERAARKYIEAADFALTHYANDQAIALYTKGLSYLSDADIDLKLHAFHDLGTVYAVRGEHDQALAYFREMLRYSWLLNDLAKGGVAHNKVGRAYRALGEYDHAMQHLQRALELFRDASDMRGVASTLDDIGQIHWVRGRFEDALKYYSAGLQLRREIGDDRSIALSLNHVGNLYLGRGDLKKAMVYFRESLALRRKIGDRQGVADTYNNLAALCLERGQEEQARTLFSEALEIAQSIGYRTTEAILLNNLGEVSLRLDDLDDAQVYLSDAQDAAEASGDKRVLVDIHRNTGELLMRRGDMESAIEEVEEALALAGELDSRTLVGMAKQTMAEILAAVAEDDEAQGDRTGELFEEASQILREVGSESQLARCLSSYGEFLLQRGNKVQGRARLEVARDLFERLQMRGHWEATNAQLDRL
ncbi:MAG: tetratricopeptide repeat protein [Myxococcota bacterium]